jgi:hypothetical protein
MASHDAEGFDARAAQRPSIEAERLAPVRALLAGLDQLSAILLVTVPDEAMSQSVTVSLSF